MAPILSRSARLRDHVLAIIARNTADVEESPLATAMLNTCHPDYETRFTWLQSLERGIRERL